MPKITIAPTWDIANVEGADNWNGTLSSDKVYKFSVVPNDTTPYEVIASVANVIKRGDEQIIRLGLIYENSTFYMGDPKDPMDSISCAELANVEQMYVSRRLADSRPRAVSDDPFVFSFLNPKTGKTFTQYVDPDHFIGICRYSKAVNANRTVFGRIKKMSDDGQSIIVTALIGGGGHFTTTERVIRIADIRGIYAYTLIPVTYEEGVKFAEEARAKQAERKKAKEKPAVATADETPRNENETTAEESEEVKHYMVDEDEATDPAEVPIGGDEPDVPNDSESDESEDDEPKDEDTPSEDATDSEDPNS